VSRLAQEVGDSPVLLPELYGFGEQAEQLAAAKPASYSFDPSNSGLRFFLRVFAT
jgi:hypothetical protein